MKFDAHTVGDIKQAAEELTLLLTAEQPPTAVECEVSVDDWAATVKLCAATRPRGAAQGQGGYRWHALIAITDSLGVVTDETDRVPDGHTEITFTRRRVAGQPFVSEPSPDAEWPPVRRSAAERV